MKGNAWLLIGMAVLLSGLTACGTMGTEQAAEEKIAGENPEAGETAAAEA